MQLAKDNHLSSNLQSIYSNSSILKNFLAFLYKDLLVLSTIDQIVKTFSTRNARC